MSRSRFFAVTLLGAAVAITVQTSKSEEHKTAGDPFIGVKTTLRGGSDAPERTYTIYSLAELGADADLGKWITETIPEVIEPGTWKGQGVLRYHAPKNILVVYHTPAVQAKVDGFLKNVKKSLPSAKASKATTSMTSAPPAIVPASHRAPALLKASTPTSEPQFGYAVPAPVKAPKHLFHFIIRYEGEGIIDDNVVKFMKAQIQGNKKEEGSSTATIGNVLAPLAGYATVPPSSGTVVSPAAPATVAPPLGISKQEDKKTDKKDSEDKEP